MITLVKSSLIFSLLAAIYFTPYVAAIEFDMVFQTKCIFKEVIEEDYPVLGSFEAFSRDNHGLKTPLSIKIENPLGEIVFEKANVETTDFTINHPMEGEYRVCFTAKAYATAANTRIGFKWREGVEATNWDSVAKKDNLDSVHTQLLRLEDAVHSIHIDLQHIRRKEEHMRDINELTNTRVAYCSIGALMMCVGLAALQLWNLRRFFVRKKIL